MGSSGLWKQGLEGPYKMQGSPLPLLGFSLHWAGAPFSIGEQSSHVCRMSWDLHACGMGGGVL